MGIAGKNGGGHTAFFIHRPPPLRIGVIVLLSTRKGTRPAPSFESRIEEANELLQLLEKSKASEVALLHSIGNLKEIEDQLPNLKIQAPLAYVRALKLLGRK